MTTSTAWIAKPVATASAASRPSLSGDPRPTCSDEVAAEERLASSVADTPLTLRVKSAVAQEGRLPADDRSRLRFPARLRVSQAQTHLPRLRHRRPVRMLPVVYRHTTVSRRDAFLVSYPKSGNTWLRFMLTHLLSGSEADFDRDSTVIARGWIPPGHARRAPGRGTHDQEPRALFGARKNAFYRKAIYLVRDGRDVAVSYYYTLIRRGLFAGEFSPFLRLFLDGGVDGYGPWHGTWSRGSAARCEQSGSLLVLKYEELLKEPVRERVRRDGVPRQAGLREQGSRRRSTRTARTGCGSESASPASTRTQKRSDIMFVRTAGSGDWARTFAPEDEELFARVTGDLLPRLGYTAPAQRVGVDERQR